MPQTWPVPFLPLLCDENDHQGDDQSVDSDGFSETKTEDHGCADVARGVGVAPNGLCSAPRADPEADAWADSAKTDGEARTERLHGCRGDAAVRLLQYETQNVNVVHL